MGLENKINNTKISESFVFIGINGIALILSIWVTLYFEVNTKRYDINIENLTYSIRAVKQRDTHIYVYKNENEFIKQCTIEREKKEIIPAIKGVHYKTLEKRTEEYIMPTEKELYECYNPLIKILQ